jgi:adenosylhomocysteine nucleosidase
LALNAVGVVCALASEARHLGPLVHAENRRRRFFGPRFRSGPQRGATHGLLSAGPVQVGSLEADGLLIAITGMGGPAASKGAAALIGAGATALASFGLAGGLDPALQAGAILLPAEVVGPEGRGVPTAQGWRERLASALSEHTPCCGGRLLTMPRAVGSVAEKAHLFQMTRAAAVDMESLAVGEAANTHRLPFVAVRVIVDSAGDVLPGAVTAAADREGHLHIWRLIAALARAPGALAPVIRLACRYRVANRSLAAIARTGSLSPPTLT